MYSRILIDVFIFSKTFRGNCRTSYPETTAAIATPLIYKTTKGPAVAIYPMRYLLILKGWKISLNIYLCSRDMGQTKNSILILRVVVKIKSYRGQATSIAYLFLFYFQEVSGVLISNSSRKSTSILLIFFFRFHEVYRFESKYV